MKTDKKLHFWAGLLIALFIALPVYFETYKLGLGVYAALYASIIAGAVKEYTDYRHTKVWDWMDFLATCLGAVIVVLLILALHFGKG